MADEVRLIDANSVCKSIVESIRYTEEWISEAREQQDTIGLQYASNTYSSLISMLERIQNEPTVEVKPDNGWINVDDRLPEPYTMVLVHDTDGKIFTVIYKNDYLQFITGYTITHWQPLPEPPKGDNAE